MPVAAAEPRKTFLNPFITKFRLLPLLLVPSTTAPNEEPAVKRPPAIWLVYNHARRVWSMPPFVPMDVVTPFIVSLFVPMLKPVPPSTSEPALTIVGPP